MSQDYGSATINAMTTSGPPGGPAVQPPIGYDRLTGANTEMWNGEIGVKLSQASPASDMATPVLIAGYPAAPGTVGRDKAGALMTWATCVAGCAAGTTGTLTGSVFVAGAGAAVAQSTIAANGYGWVKN